MKLPDIEYNRPVQSLGREDVNAPIRVAAAGAAAASYAGAGLRELGAGMVKLSGFLQAQEEKYAEHEAQMAVLEATREMQDIQARRASTPEVSVADLPDSIRANMEPGSYKVVGNELVREDRTTIPYHEIQVDLFDFDSAQLGEKYAGNLKTEKARKMFTEAWGKHAIRTRGSVVNSAVNTSREIEAAKTGQAAQDAADAGDWETAEALIRTGVPALFSPVEAQKAINQFKMDAAKAAPRAAMLAGDIQEMEAHIANLQREDYDGFLSVDNRISLVQSLKDRVAKVKAETTKALRDENARAVAGLYMAVDDGAISQEELFASYQSDLISREQFVSLSRQLHQTNQAQVSQIQTFADFSQAIANGESIDDSDPATRKQLDAYWEAGGGSFDLAKMMATHSGVMPEAATHKMLRDSNSNNDDAALAAAEFYLDVTNAGKGYLFKSIDGEKSEFLRNLAENLDSGYEPQPAIQQARRVADMDPSTRAAISMEYPKVEGDNRSSLISLSNSDDNTDIAFFGDADPPYEMQGEFNRHVRNNYIINGGDIDKARKAAFRQLTSVWGSSNASPHGSQVIMKYPPERVYGLESSDLEEHIREYVAPYSEFNDELDVDSIFIVSDNATKEDPVRNGWPLMFEDKHGGIRQMVNARGMPIRYVPSRESVLALKAQRAADEVIMQRNLRSGKTVESAPRGPGETEMRPLNPALDQLNRWRESLR